MFGIGQPFAKRVQPYNRAPDCRGFAESRGVGRDRDTEAGRGEIILKERGEGRMRSSRGDVGDEILGAHGAAQALRKKGQKLRWKIRAGRASIAPKRENSAAERAFVVIEIGNEAGYCERRTTGRRRSRQRGDVNLLI